MVSKTWSRSWSLTFLLLHFAVVTVVEICVSRLGVEAQLFGARPTNPEDKVNFYLYNDPDKFELTDGIKLDLGNVSELEAVGFSPKVPLKILIHGFKRNYTCTFPQVVKDAYFDKGFKYNIVLVDWHELSSPPGGRSRLSTVRKYFIALANFPAAGRKIRDLILTLQDNQLNDLNSTHIIGFSLGAHVAGYAGEGVAEKYPEKIGRITGLDPAGPRFRLNWNGGPRRLHKEDAQFVDIVHTNMGISALNTLGLDGHLGLRFSIGHADFFVNGGGPYQVGCHRNSSCSHAAAHNYFLQSIGTDEIKACRCDLSTYSHNSCQPCTSQLVTFGEGVSHDAAGDFYLDMRRVEVDVNKKYTC